MAAKIKANFGQRLPGRTRAGSQAYFRKAATLDARAGMANVLANYSAFIASMGGATQEAIMEALEPAYERSQEYVPKDTGALSESGSISPTADGGAEITYGDSRAWYAALVHEYTWLNHKAPTRAKYLQAALEEEMDSFIVSIGLALSGFFGS